MKKLLFIAVALTLTACASTEKPKGYVLPPAMREVFRGGELTPLQTTQPDALGMDFYDHAMHNCTSYPIYSLYTGEYVTTKVRCW